MHEERKLESGGGVMGSQILWIDGVVMGLRSHVVWVVGSICRRVVE